MVDRSQDWDWSSLKPTARSGPEGLLSDGLILKPVQWLVKSTTFNQKLNSSRSATDWLGAHRSVILASGDNSSRTQIGTFSSPVRQTKTAE
jgi:hypothetical protein